MITVNSRRVAAILMLAASVTLITLGVIIAVSNRFTGHEALAGFIALLAAAAAGLWLRQGKRSDKEKPS